MASSTFWFPVAVLRAMVLGARWVSGRRAGRWMGAVSGAGLLGCWTALAMIGATSWARTTPLRRGRSPPDRIPLSGGRTSRATCLPGAAGLCLAGAALGAAWGHLASPIALSALGGVGAFVVATGFRSRVRAVEANPDGLVLRYSARAPFAARWCDVTRLSPPRVPWGGWRIHTTLSPEGDPRHVGRTLMPSDLLGRESFLSAVIQRSALRFDHRAGWRREEASAELPAGPMKGVSPRPPRGFRS